MAAARLRGQARALQMALPVLLAVLSCSAAAASGAAGPLSFMVRSRPVRLRYGEVYNKLQEPMKLPQEVVDRYADGTRTMAVTGFDVDMVRVDARGSESKVLLSDHYLHHYILNLGREDSIQGMLEAASRNPTFARMLTGCHAMMGAGVRSYLGKLEREKPGARQDLAVFGSAAGAEYRDNPQRFEAPFRRLLRQPQIWTPVLHIINTRRPATGKPLPWSPLLECPCTPQRRINVTAGTIDGAAADPPIHCSPEFAATGNPSCHLATYQGGWRCCEHRMFLVDTDRECARPDCSEKPQDEVYMKFTFYYEDAAPGVRPIEAAACCDVTSVTQGNENIEYDVPRCKPGTPPAECVHVVETVQPLAYYGSHPKSPGDSHKASDLVDLVFAAPHLHLAGMSLELIDQETNRTLCEVHQTGNNTGGVAYGHGATPGDEEGYMVGLSTCRWGGDRAPRFRRDHPLRTRAVYNATMGHTGVMSLWLMDVSAVEAPDYLV